MFCKLLKFPKHNTVLSIFFKNLIFPFFDTDPQGVLQCELRISQINQYCSELNVCGPQNFIS